DDVTGVEQVGQLLGKDFLVRGVVCPGGQERDVVGERCHPHAGSALDDGGLRKVTGEMGRIGRAAPVADDVDVAATGVGVEDDLDDALDGADGNLAEHRTDLVDVALQVHRHCRRPLHQLHRRCPPSIRNRKWLAIGVAGQAPPASPPADACACAWYAWTTSTGYTSHIAVRASRSVRTASRTACWPPFAPRCSAPSLSR